MLWTLILSLTVVTLDGTSTHTVTVPNIPTKEACRAAGQQHVDKYNAIYIPSSSGRYSLRGTSFAAVYTCVEQGKF